MAKPAWMGGSAKPEWINEGQRVPEDHLRALEELKPEIVDVFGDRGILTLHGLRHRIQQQSLANAIFHNLRLRKHGLNQAGTGTGKSIAYIVPAIYHAIRNQVKVIIATSNKGLQNQLTNKDLPFLQDALRDYLQAKEGRNFRHAQLVGKFNYLCKTKCAEHLSENSRGTEAVVYAFWKSTRTGQIGECDVNLCAPEHYHLRKALTGCSNRHACPSCFYWLAKQAAQEADIVVVNHALLASHYLAGRNILPVFDVVIVDEAHAWESALRDSTVTRLSRGQLLPVILKAEKYLLPEHYQRICQTAKPLFHCRLSTSVATRLSA